MYSLGLYGNYRVCLHAVVSWRQTVHSVGVSLLVWLLFVHSLPTIDNNGNGDLLDDEDEVDSCAGVGLMVDGVVDGEG